MHISYDHVNIQLCLLIPFQRVIIEFTSIKNKLADVAILYAYSNIT